MKYIFSYTRALDYEKFSLMEDTKNLVPKYLINKFDFKNKLILEVGCGTGRYTKYIAPLSKKYYVLEPSKNMIKIAENKCAKIKQISFFNCDAQSIPLPNNSVDYVFASWALSSMGLKKSKNIAFREMKRVLKKNGQIVLVENWPQSEFVKLIGINSLFNDSESVYFIKKFGFKIIKKINSGFDFKTIKQAKDTLKSLFLWVDMEKFFKNKKIPKIKHVISILSFKK